MYLIMCVQIKNHQEKAACIRHSARIPSKRKDRQRNTKKTYQRNREERKKNYTIHINPIVIRISIVDSKRNRLHLDGKTNENHKDTTGSEWWIFERMDGGYETIRMCILYWVHVDINRERNMYRFVSLAHFKCIL